MQKIRCQICGNTMGVKVGDWLKVQLPGIKNKRFIFVKEYRCECGWSELKSENE